MYPPSTRDKLKKEALGSHRGRKRGEGRPERRKKTRALAQTEFGLVDGSGGGGETEVNGDSRSTWFPFLASLVGLIQVSIFPTDLNCPHPLAT